MDDNQKEEFTRGLSSFLESADLGGNIFSSERELTEAIWEVVGDYIKSSPYKDEVTRELQRSYMPLVKAFGREHGPDICLKQSREPFLAIELKLFKDGYGLARGIGQAIFNTKKYDYGIIFVADERKPEKDDASKHVFDEEIKSLLWDSHKIKLIFQKVNDEQKLKERFGLE